MVKLQKVVGWLLSDFGKEIFDSLLPDGDIWKPVIDGDLYKFYQANGDIIQDMIDQVGVLADFRNPLKTPILNDLEREFAILKNPNLSESTRRMQLNAKKYKEAGNGSKDDLQDALDNAGFDLQVHKNNPPVDPAIFLAQNFQMVAGGADAVAGNQDAFAGLLGGYLLVNGFTYTQEPAYSAQANGVNAFAGNAAMVAGAFEGLQKVPIEYQIPTDPLKWGYIFFVGGDATRDPVTDELTDIQQGLVPQERQTELENIILSIKGLFSWAGMIITYT